MSIRFVCPRCWSVREDLDDCRLGQVVKCHECHGMSVATHTPDPQAKRRKSKAKPKGSPAPTEVPEVANVEVVIAAPAGIVLSTGGIPATYEIIDVVFAHASTNEAKPATAALTDLFDTVKGRLARQAAELDATAVIHIHFEFRTPQPGLESSLAYDVFACGTAVKILSP